jgi:hypothetical protein
MPRLAQVDAIPRVVPRRVRWTFWGVVAAVLVTVVVTFRNPWFFGNIGVVAPGRVYRSAQPGGDFPQVTARFHLASILNLRGGSLADTWYKAEVDTARAQGIDFYDLPLSATRRPRRRELLILLDFFERCRYPLLIHCKSGSDRTGLAAALYLVSQKGERPEQAERAFSLQYGHIPLLGPEHLHEPFQEYAAWLLSNLKVHSPFLFRAWVEKVYEPEEASRAVPVPHLRPGPRQPSP